MSLGEKSEWVFEKSSNPGSMAPFSDALLAAIAGGDSSRVISGVVLLLSLGAFATLLSIPALTARQRAARMRQLGLTSATQQPVGATRAWRELAQDVFGGKTAIGQCAKDSHVAQL